MAANALSELGDVAFQIARFEGALRALKAERTYQIRKLLGEGYTEREIAQYAGVSNARVHQIKREATA